MNIFRISAIFLLVLLLAGPALSNGPRIPPCEGCPQSEDIPYPQIGFWFDPDRSGSGFNIDLQNGILAGAYYGYSEDGQAQWFTFSGRLQRSETAGEYWTLDTELLRFSGGSCIDCEYQAPDAPEPAHRIELKVLQRNLISYRLDGGEEYRVQPLIYGTQMRNLFPAVSDHGLPLFEGERLTGEGSGMNETPWLLTIRDPNRRFGNPRSYTQSLGIMWTPGFTGEPVPPRDTVSMRFFQYVGNIDVFPPVSVHCQTPQGLVDGGYGLTPGLLATLGDGPVCVVRSLGTVSADFDYYVAPLANFGDDYFFATAEDGRVIEGHRLLYK